MSRKSNFTLRAVLITASFLLTLVSAAQRTASVGFYNVENLFDTIPSGTYNDSAYTPGGRNRWNTERYNNKLRNIARVLDDMSLDVAGLAEVENETTLRDLLQTLSTDYNYIYRKTGGRDGRAIAMLYKGDRFVPDETRQLRSSSSRKPLYIRGMLCGRRVDLVVCHQPSLLNRYEHRERTMRSLYAFADSLCRADTCARLVIMGDFNAAPGDKVMLGTFCAPGSALFCPLENLAAQGAGSYAYNNKWALYDNIYVSARLRTGNVKYEKSGIFIRPYLLTGGNTRRRGYPLRTFNGKKYMNGFSDHLPVYLFLKIE